MNHLLTRQEAVDILRIHLHTLDRMMDRGELTRYKIGASVRLSAQEVAEMAGLDVAAVGAE